MLLSIHLEKPEVFLYHFYTLNPVETLGKSLECLRNFGIDETLGRILARLGLISEFRSLDIYMRELGSVQWPAPIGTMEVREVFPTEIEKLAFAEDLPPLAEIRQQFSKGSRLIALFDSTLIVAVNWVNGKFADLTHIGLPATTFPTGTLYFHSAMVSHSLRNLGLGTFLKQTALRQLKREGSKRVFSSMYLRDSRVQKWNAMNGFRKWGCVFCFNRLGQKYRWIRLTKLGRTHYDLLNGIQEGISPIE